MDRFYKGYVAGYQEALNDIKKHIQGKSIDGMSEDTYSAYVEISMQCDHLMLISRMAEAKQ